MSILKRLFIYSLLCFYPYLSYAQYTRSTNRLSQFLLSFGGLLSLATPAIFGLALIYFFWGTANFILSAGNEKTRRDGINKMIWGLVALFVFVSIYGILGALQSAINL